MSLSQYVLDELAALKREGVEIRAYPDGSVGLTYIESHREALKHDHEQRHQVASILLNSFLPDDDPHKLKRMAVVAIRELAKHARKEAALAGSMHGLWESISYAESAAAAIEALLPPE